MIKVDFFGKEYGWSKEDTLQLTVSEIQTLESIIIQRRQKEKRG